MGRFFGRQQAPQPEPGEEPAAESAEAPVTVVVVDDDEDVRELLQLGLTTDVYSVVGTAGSAPDAVELVRRAQPEIVLLDLHMPDMGGLEVLPLLREECPTAKYVAFSAIGATHMLENAMSAGFLGFIEKGVSISSIIKHLDRVVAAGRVKFVRPFPLNRDYR
jgi:DNA-binding NarL/FixJ family response regulator